jgi:hypothetical protein
VKRALLFPTLLAVALTCLGCGGTSPPGEDATWLAEAKAPNQKGDEEKAAGANAAEVQPRKIIYTATIDLVVEEFDNVEEELASLVKEQHGYLARSDVRGTPGSPRSGSWTVRVPVEHFTEVVAALGKLGELRQSKTDSDDVTDRYYDLKAHIKNNQVAEEGYQKLLIEKSANGKLEDVVAIMKQLHDIRGTIESQQGQLKRMDKDVAMSTIILQIHDRKDYVPTTTPTFGTSIGRTFQGSIDALLTFGRGIVLVAVAMAPWLAVLAVPAVPGWWLIRRKFRNGRGHAGTVLPVEPPAAS